MLARWFLALLVLLHEAWSTSLQCLQQIPQAPG
jgi:hypothetical protein